MKKSYFIYQTFCYLITLVIFTVMSYIAFPVWAGSVTRTFWTTQDVVDQRISVDAQYSLIRMCRSQESAKRADVTSMLSAILDDKSLAGIYQVDFKPSAERAGKLGRKWWDLIPKNKNSICVEGLNEFGKEAPMIVYRKQIATYKEVLDAEIGRSWAICRKNFNLPQLQAIPCQIAKRAKSTTLDCQEEMWPEWDRIFKDCHETRTPKAAWGACREVCTIKVTGIKGNKFTFFSWACADEKPECATVAQQAKVCKDYADKQLPDCP